MRLWFNGGIHVGRVTISGSAFMLILISFLFSAAVYKIDNANTAKSNAVAARVAVNSERIAVLSWTQCVQTRGAVDAANKRWTLMKAFLIGAAKLHDNEANNLNDGAASAERELAKQWRAMGNAVYPYPLQDCGPRP